MRPAERASPDPVKVTSLGYSPPAQTNPPTCRLDHRPFRKLRAVNAYQSMSRSQQLARTTSTKRDAAAPGPRGPSTTIRFATGTREVGPRQAISPQRRADHASEFSPTIRLLQQEYIWLKAPVAYNCLVGVARRKQHFDRWLQALHCSRELRSIHRSRHNNISE